MINQLKMVAIGMDTTSIASDNSGSQANVQDAVAVPSHLCPIPGIHCGGAGSRLRSLSLELHRKPFFRLSDRLSWLQKAYLRGAKLPGVRHLIAVTNHELFFNTEDEFCEVNAANASTSFILDLFGRNTAAGRAAAALQVTKAHDPDAILLVMAVDHLIADQTAFQQAVAEAIELAQQSKLVTFGVQPDGPDTGYGFIESDGNRVLRFVEKPSLGKAKVYLDSGRFLWNAGIFCFVAGTVVEQMVKHCPAIMSATRACIEQSRLATGDGFSQLELEATAFKYVPDESIDYAVMEKSEQVAVVPCNFRWSDIGSWSALGDLNAADTSGNRIQGEAMVHNTNNCTIQSNDRLVAAVGVENLIIIDTPDAVLLANKDSAQDVKYNYAELKAKGHEAHKLHLKVHRPWGTFTVQEEVDGFKIRRIEVKPSAYFSLHMHRHRHRSEHRVVVNGAVKLLNAEREILINTNESTFKPAGHKHRLKNPGTALCVMIEVQSGRHLGEDDIVRFEDNYARK